MHQQQLRVALLNPCFWPEVQRGSERLIRDLATDVIAAGHSPRLITSHPRRLERTVEDGLPITRHRRPPEAALAARGFERYLTHLPFSYLDLRVGDDQLAQAFYPTDAVAAVRWARQTGRPAVFHYGGVPQRAVLSSRRLRTRIASEAIYGADAVVVDSDAAARGMRRWFGVEARIINPGVRLERFSPATQRTEQPTIACAADPSDARKRVPLLRRAFELVRRERRDARLQLVRPRDRALETALAGDGVEFFEPAPDASANVFPRAWATALAAYNEAFGIVLVESLAAGTPAVAARDGGVPEIIDRPDVGRLFDGDRVEDVARALLEGLELGADPQTAPRCRQRAEAFRAERCAEQHVALWQELIESARAARS